MADLQEGTRVTQPRDLFDQGLTVVGIGFKSEDSSAGPIYYLTRDGKSLDPHEVKFTPIFEREDDENGGWVPDWMPRSKARQIAKGMKVPFHEL